MGNVEVAYTKKGGFLLFIRHFHISHNTPSLPPPPPPNFSMTLSLYFPWVLQSFQEKLKTAYAKQGLLWKMWKWRIIPVSFFTFLLFTKRANLTTIYKIFITLTLIKAGWKKEACRWSWVLRKWHILGNWWIWQGFIKGLGKNLNGTTKEAYWQLAIFTKMANWRNWQESIKGFAKSQIRWQRGKSWQMAITRKWQILGEKGKFGQKWRVC